ncbi:MAG: Txe/YoeB family addiction module toxin [Rhodoferax sp.]|nr:Txe/YoeB family addiction module toxin [Rhodoferax sp.]
MARSLRFTPAAWDDYTYWQGQDKKTLRRINTLIEAVARDPFTGIGKPEPLMGNMAGYWSRRIDDVHRLVYTVDDADLDVIACRGHYDD